MRHVKQWCRRLMAFVIVLMLVSSDFLVHAENTTTETGAADVTAESVSGNQKAGVKSEATTVSDNAAKSGTSSNEDAKEKREENKKSAETVSGNTEDIEEDFLYINLGYGNYKVTNKPEEGEESFEEDGSYVIDIPEENPYFPYQVQITYNDQVSREWFMSPDSTLIIGDHILRVNPTYTKEAIKQLTLNIGGEEVIIYPEEKSFPDGVMMEPESLLNLQTKYLTVDLSKYTPAELTRVKVSQITSAMAENPTQMTWSAYSNDWDYGSGYSDVFSMNSSTDSINLSYTSLSNQMTWSVITGGDQLNPNAIKYKLTVKNNIDNWLVPTVYKETTTWKKTDKKDEDGDYLYDAEKAERTSMTVSFYNYYTHSGSSIYLDKEYSYKNPYGSYEVYASGDMSSAYDITDASYKEDDLWMAFSLNASEYAGGNAKSIRVFKGEHSSSEEAMKAEDVTNLCVNADMTKVGTGIKWGNHDPLTVVAFDATGKALGSQVVVPSLFISSSGSGNYSVTSFPNYGLYTEDGTSVLADDQFAESKYENDIYYPLYTYFIYRNFPCNGNFYLKASAVEGITGIYQGIYATESEAIAAGAQNIKDIVFGDQGYLLDCNQEIRLSTFAGDQRDLVAFRTKASPKSGYSKVTFSGLIGSDGKNVNSHIIDAQNDDYAEDNFVTYVVNPSVDVTRLAPEFSLNNNIHLYAKGSSSPEESGKSYHDFSGGTIQYTASSENGYNATNYWLTVMKAVIGKGQLYISSFSDPESKTRTENGVTYSEREIVLDSVDAYHDILITNVGTESIPKLTVELNSDVVELDPYWTFKGENGLAGIDLTSTSSNLSNMSKLRLRAKSGIDPGAAIEGTLTIKSNGNPVIVLTLKGMAGSPVITTTSVPNAVKYVPYGTFIQNSNKYSKNEISYELFGTLPSGVVLMPNGELYGVPKETGDFKFSVEMFSSLSGTTTMSNEMTLTVVDNTDPNVDGSTDDGYTVSQRIPDIAMNDTNSYTFVSVGVINEYKYVFLDGEKLTEGTDYTAESGSTRITLKGQTLTRSQSDGRHTLGVEFRTTGDGTLRRAAQNYYIHESGWNGTNDGAGSGSGSGSNAGGSAVAPTTYVVKKGDTLWSIAKAFYGNGAMWSKIFEDNKSVIKDPNKIYVGMVLKLYPTISVAIAGTPYTIQSGDTLSSIARKVYGSPRKWRDIYKANKETIKNPNKIYKGQVIVLPQ